MGKKNYGKSVKTRLLNLMNETGYKYMYLLASSSIKVYDIHGLYIKTVKNLGETVGLPSGKYILNYYTGETLIKTSKLLK